MMNPILYFAGKLNPKAYYRIAQLRYKIPFFGKVLSVLGSFIRNRDGTIQNGFGKGLKFNVGDSIAGYLLGTQEPHVQAAIAQLIKPGMTAFDLGANVGFLSLLLARAVGANGKVVSFEPVPRNAEQLAHNVALNGFENVAVRMEAVGESNGQIAFIFGDFPTIGKFKKNRADQSSPSQDVPIRSLDSLIAAKEVCPPDFVKMDIEGAEVDCLRGATTLLGSLRPLFLIEVHNTNEAINEILVGANYESVVLGSSETIIEGHWNVQVLAFPAEKPLPPATRNILTDVQLTPWR